MNMGGIGIGFGFPPQRMNQPPQQPFIGGNQGFGGFNPLNNPIGLGLNPTNLPPNMSNLNKMMPPPINRPLWTFDNYLCWLILHSFTQNIYNKKNKLKY